MERLSEHEIDKFGMPEEGDYDLLKFNFSRLEPSDLTKMRSLNGHIRQDVKELFDEAKYGDIHAYMMANSGAWELCEAYITDFEEHEAMRKTNFARMISAKTQLEVEVVSHDTIHLYAE